ncbi:MAG TPA: acyltransferase domain-containing protein [Longimicrobiaceae bacterium]|nr:acyltransferase domain-containing protein [Longimicrobiaceae bacterium]
MTDTVEPAGAPALRQAAPAARPWQLLAFAAPEAEMEAATDRLAEHLRAHPDADLAAVARALHARAGAGGRRRVLVAKDAEDAAAALAARDPQRVFTAAEPDGGERPVVFLFPGLGEQYVGMARGLYRAEPAFRAELDRCADVLLPHLGADLREVLFPDAPEAPAGGAPAGGGIDLRAMLGRMKQQGDAATQRLNRTELAQPAVFAVEVALARLWLSWGVRPVGMIGHSLGEYAAATVAGVLPLEGALELVARRAAMIGELPGGVMLAVPLSEEDARPLLSGGLAIGAVNAPSTCVVSGPEDAVAAMEAKLAEMQLVSRRLPTTHAFHSPMMEPVARAFTEMVRGMELGEPSLPFVSNVTGTWVTADEARDPGYWTRHLVGTVRFADGVRELASDPRRVFVEVGPGQTLGAFARQSGASQQIVLPSIRQSYNKQPDTAFLLGSLGRLWLAGVPVAWDGLYPGTPPTPADLSAVFAD